MENVEKVKGATPPFCKDCKFFKLIPDARMCTKPLGVENLVNGKGWEFAVINRESDTACGKVGRYWEPKLGLWKRIKNYFYGND